MIELRMFKYRIYPSRKQQGILLEQFKICKEVYNELLFFAQKDLAVSKFDFDSIIKEMKICHSEYYSAVYSQVLQNISDRLSKAFDNFFSRAKLKRKGIKIKAGYPRFKRKIQSITYPQSGFKILSDKRIRLSKIGSIPVVLHRIPKGKIKRLSIKQNKVGQWFAIFSCEIEFNSIHPSKEKIGIDVGIERFGTLSQNLGIIENPKFFRKSERKLARLQRRLSRKTLRSHNWQKSRIKVARCHLKIFNQRTDFLHQVSHRLAIAYSEIKVENLTIKNMIKNHCLAKSIADAGWGRFFQMLTYKEVTLGGQVLKVDAKRTSKECSICGTLVDMPLAKRKFLCPKCGFSCHRDNNSANVISQRNTVGLTGINACGC